MLEIVTKKCESRVTKCTWHTALSLGELLSGSEGCRGKNRIDLLSPVKGRE